MLAEYASWGIIPEMVTNQYGSGVYPADNLPAKLRLRHGGKPSGNPPLTDRDEPAYNPRASANCGFSDGHVERVHWSRLIDNKSPIWLGNRPPGYKPTF